MNLLRPLLLTVLVLALASCGGPSTTTTTTSKNTNYEFKKLCQTLGASDNRISRDQFIAASKDKQVAAQLFDACDVNRTGYITEKEAEEHAVPFESLKQQVIMFHTPRP